MQSSDLLLARSLSDYPLGSNDSPITYLADLDRRIPTQIWMALLVKKCVEMALQKLYYRYSSCLKIILRIRDFNLELGTKQGLQMFWIACTMGPAADLNPAKMPFRSPTKVL